MAIPSLKRIDTFRWNAREISLHVSLERYDSILSVLEQVSQSNTDNGEKRNTSLGLIDSFQSKQFLATAYLFREIFSITGCILQSVNIDFGTALDLIDSAINKLKALRSNPGKVIRIVESHFDPKDFRWEENRIRRRKRLHGKNANDEQA